MKRSPLKSDPAKTAAFVRRGRVKLKRRASKPAPGARGWTQRVFELYGDRCVVCGWRAVHGHHVVGKAIVRAARHLTVEQRAALASDARNGAPICAKHHFDHEAAARRIPFDRLPAGAVQWALQHGFEGRVMDRRVYPR